jgi:hypothetical protein
VENREIGTDKFAEVASTVDFDDVVQLLFLVCTRAACKLIHLICGGSDMSCKGRSAARSRDLGADPKVSKPSFSSVHLVATSRHTARK